MDKNITIANTTSAILTLLMAFKYLISLCLKNFLPTTDGIVENIPNNKTGTPKHKINNATRTIIPNTLAPFPYTIFININPIINDKIPITMPNIPTISPIDDNFCNLSKLVSLDFFV